MHRPADRIQQTAFLRGFGPDSYLRGFAKIRGQTPQTYKGGDRRGVPSLAIGPASPTPIHREIHKRPGNSALEDPAEECKNQALADQSGYGRGIKSTRLNRMKSKNQIVHLRSLRQEIADLCVVKCQMSHERIIRTGESLLPAVSRLPEGSYQRVGLCSPEVRSQRLGCSHTMARVKLEDALDRLKNGDGENSGPCPSLGRELNELDNQIHLLDHEKGEAEKTLAQAKMSFARDRTRGSATLKEAQETVRDQERMHNEYVERIGMLRDKILTEIDRLIRQVEARLRDPV